jgi:hypothetical protein
VANVVGQSQIFNPNYEMKLHDHLDNLLRELRKHYKDVRMWRQQGLTTPAGFCRSSNHQTQFIIHTPPRKSAAKPPDPPIQLLSDLSTLSVDHSVETKLHNNRSTTATLDSVSTESDATPFIPIIHSVDKPSSSLPKNITMTEDLLRPCVGFRRIDLLKKNMSTLYQSTITLDTSTPDAVLEPGFYATIRKKDRNTAPVPRPHCFGDAVHLDIVYGPEISIRNIQYGLLCIDRFSRMTYLYPLQNLTGDIQKQLEAFFAHIGMVPKRIVTDFDTKLVGGTARAYPNSLLVHVNAAPSYRQDKNGLAERHWQTMVSVARNWLASAELSPSFWFYTVRRAAEVCNYFPLPLEDGSFSTPFTLVHQQKPDLRVLFKPFTLAAVRRERIGNDNLQKFDA